MKIEELPWAKDARFTMEQALFVLRGELGKLCRHEGAGVSVELKKDPIVERNYLFLVGVRFRQKNGVLQVPIVRLDDGKISLEQLCALAEHVSTLVGRYLISWNLGHVVEEARGR